MNTKTKKVVGRIAENIDRKELGMLLLQVLPLKPGGVRTEEFKKKLRKEFGKTTEQSSLNSRDEMKRVAQLLLVQMHDHKKTSPRPSNSVIQQAPPQSAPSSSTSVSEGPKPPQGANCAQLARSLEHFRFEHPAIIAQRLRRLPAKSQEIELDQLEGEVARQVKFLICQFDSVAV